MSSNNYSPEEDMFFIFKYTKCGKFVIRFLFSFLIISYLVILSVANIYFYQILTQCQSGSIICYIGYPFLVLYVFANLIHGFIVIVNLPRFLFKNH